MNIQEQLQNDLKAAMRAGERTRVEVIRMTLAALKNARLALLKEAYDAAGGGEAAADAVDTGQQLSDQAMLDTIAKEARRRREAAELYRKAGRDELAQQEEAEAAILDAYLPRQMSADELRPLVAAVIAELGASGPAEMGKVMPVLMQRFKGKAEGRTISQVAREVLGQR